MVCFGRHTITGLLRLQNRSQQDWTADYRFYAEDHFDEDKAFASLRCQIDKDLTQDAPLVSAMDDSMLRKTGTRINGVRYMRDPMSPVGGRNSIVVEVRSLLRVRRCLT